MNLIYGRWTKEELEKRRSSVFDPFQEGSKWYRIKELVVGPLGANYQAEEISGPEAASAQTVPPVEPPPREVVVAEPIRRWARSKGLLPPRVPGERGNGPAYLPKEVRAAYREEFGPEVLDKMLWNDSVDARRLYAEEGDGDPRTLYKVPSELAAQNLSAEELNTFYREVPRQVSEARIKARDSAGKSRQAKREAAILAAKQITDPIVQQRTKPAVQKKESA